MNSAIHILCLMASLCSTFWYYQFVGDNMLCFVYKEDSYYTYKLYCLERQAIVKSYNVSKPSLISTGSHEDFIVHSLGYNVISSGTEMHLPDEFMKSRRFGEKNNYCIEEIFFVYGNKIYERAPKLDFCDDDNLYFVNVWEKCDNTLCKIHTEEYNQPLPWATEVINISSRYHLSFESQSRVVSINKKVEDYFYIRLVLPASFAQVDFVVVEGRFLSAFAVSPSSVLVVYEEDSKAILRSVSISGDGTISVENQLLTSKIVRPSDHYLGDGYYFTVAEKPRSIFTISITDVFNPESSSFVVTHVSEGIPKVNRNRTKITVVENHEQSLVRVYEIKDNSLKEMATVSRSQLGHNEGATAREVSP